MASKPGDDVCCACEVNKVRSGFSQTVHVLPVINIQMGPRLLVKSYINKVDCE